MNLKTVLLCSAALGMPSVAYAADALPEAEPMEYVRICDVYGTAFYYIPGTETCLRIGGYLRYDIGVGDVFGETSYDKEDFLEDGTLDENDTYYKRARFMLSVDSRSETELGTLRTYSQIFFNYDATSSGGFSTTEDNIDLYQAYITLAGFRVGRGESLYRTFTNVAGEVINHSLVNHSPSSTNQIYYTYSTNGFSVAFGGETGSGSTYTIDSYVPHLVGGAKYEGDWGEVSTVVGYDSVWDEWAGKARLDLEIGEKLILWGMGGYASNAEGENYYAPWDGNWAVWGGGTVELTKDALFNFQLSYDEAETFAAVANIDYTLVRHFHIIPEIAYLKSEEDDDDGSWGGFLRIQRSFF